MAPGVASIEFTIYMASLDLLSIEPNDRISSISKMREDFEGIIRVTFGILSKFRETLGCSRNFGRGIYQLFFFAKYGMVVTIRALVCRVLQPLVNMMDNLTLSHKLGGGIHIAIYIGFIAV